MPCLLSFHTEPLLFLSFVCSETFLENDKQQRICELIPLVIIRFVKLDMIDVFFTRNYNTQAELIVFLVFLKLL